MPPDAQPLSALMEANRIRLGRAILLRRLVDLPPRDGCRMAADIVEDPPEVLGSLAVLPLLIRVRSISAGSAGRILEACEVPELTRLRDLTPRWRAGLVSALRIRAEFGGGR